MEFYNSKTVPHSFEDTLVKVQEELKKEGFGIITEINVTDVFKNKLNIDFMKYRILGACNPVFAHRALLIDEKVGVMLPCNVILVEKEVNLTEVSTINPAKSMSTINITQLTEIAEEINTKLMNVLEKL